MDVARKARQTQIRSQIQELFALAQSIHEKSNAARSGGGQLKDDQTDGENSMEFQSQKESVKDLTALRSRGIALNMHMRSIVAKHLESRLRLEEQLKEILSRVDKLNLQLQSSSYEKINLLRKIAECNSIDVESAVELLPLNEYTLRTGDRLNHHDDGVHKSNNDSETSDVNYSSASFSDSKAQAEHDFLMRRLHYELRERRKLHGQIEKIRAHKEALVAIVKDRDLTLTRVKNRLESLILSCESYRNELNSASETVSYALPIVELDLSALPTSMQIPVSATVDVTPKSCIKSDEIGLEVDRMNDGNDGMVKRESPQLKSQLDLSFRERSKTDPRALLLPISLGVLYALATASVRVPQTSRLRYRWEVVIVPTPSTNSISSDSGSTGNNGIEAHYLSDDQLNQLQDLVRRGRRLSSLSLALVLIPPSQTLKTKMRTTAILLSEAIDLEMVVCRMAVVVAKSVSSSNGRLSDLSTDAKEMNASRSESDMMMSNESKRSDTEMKDKNNQMSGSTPFGKTQMDQGDEDKIAEDSSQSLNGEDLVAEYEIIETLDASPILSNLGGNASENDDAGYALPFPLFEAYGLLNVIGEDNRDKDESSLERERNDRAKYLTESVLHPVTVGRAFEWLQKLAMVSYQSLPSTSEEIGMKRSRSASYSQTDMTRRAEMSMSSFLEKAESRICEWSVFRALGEIPENGID